MSSRGKHKKSLAAFLAIVIIIGVGIFFLLQWAGHPAEQTVNVHTAPPTTTPAENVTKPVQTDYFAVAVPARYRVQTTKPADNPLQTQVFAFDTKPTGKQIGITTNLLPREGLTGVGNYEYRISKASNYQKLTDTAFPADSVLFSRTVDTPELTLFMVHGTRYASITLTGGASNAQLSELRTIFQSWQWQ